MKCGIVFYEVTSLTYTHYCHSVLSREPVIKISSFKELFGEERVRL